MTVDTAPVQVRPPVPRRVVSLFPPLLVGAAAMVVGAATAELAAGVLWGLIAAVGVIACLRLAHEPASRPGQIALFVGLAASTALSVWLMPAAPPTLDVVTGLKFGAAWLPAGLAAAFVLHQHGGRGISLFNNAFVWFIAGVFALPAAEKFGVLQPLDTLRFGVESDFGLADYMVVGLVIGIIGTASLLSSMAKMPSLVTITSVLLFTAFAGYAVGFTIVGLGQNLANVSKIPNLWPPDFEWAIGETGTWWWLPSWEFGAPLRANPLVETIRIAVASTVVGCLLALPLAFWASTLTAANKRTYLIAKGFMNVVRTIPDLFWAAIFVAAVGGGPFAGTLALTIFSMAIMSKLLSETIDSADPGPLEAAKATGARHNAAVRSSVFPQVLPNYVAYCLYVFELNIRGSAVIGLVGAGGIGRVIEAQRAFFQFDRIAAIVVVIVVLVFTLEQISVALRRRLV